MVTMTPSNNPQSVTEKNPGTSMWTTNPDNNLLKMLPENPTALDNEQELQDSQYLEL